MYSDRRRKGQKPKGQNLPDKRPPDKTSRRKLPRTIEREFVQEAFVRVVCTRHTKIRGGGGQRCVTYFWGPGICDKVCQGRGLKLAKNGVSYSVAHFCSVSHWSYFMDFFASGRLK